MEACLWGVPFSTVHQGKNRIKRSKSSSARIGGVFAHNLNSHLHSSLNAKKMLANQLYNNLPNVPIVAQNVGLGESEIMEVLIPFGSAFAYRHIGSIAQRKWRIIGVYRNKKLIMPNSATMIRPQDTILIIGRPQCINKYIYEKSTI